MEQKPTQECPFLDRIYKAKMQILEKMEMTRELSLPHLICANIGPLVHPHPNQVSLEFVIVNIIVKEKAAKLDHLLSPSEVHSHPLVSKQPSIVGPHLNAVGSVVLTLCYNAANSARFTGASSGMLHDVDLHA